MSALSHFYSSTVGKKIIMAVTGLALFGFVVAHMAGNLKAFGGFDQSGVHKLDLYAAFLREAGAHLLGESGLLWGARAALLGCVVLHVMMAVQISARNLAAKPVQYQGQRYSKASTASLSMRIGGAVLLLFIILHILHFTTGTIAGAGFVEGRVYANVFQAFQSTAITVLYLVALCAVGLHLSHGIWSAFQTLGIPGAQCLPKLKIVAGLVALAICFGFASVPLAIHFGFLPSPTH